MDGLVLALVLLGLAAFVAAPLYRRTAGRVPAPSEGRTGSIETAMADLEVDLGSGLIDRATYERERAALLSGD